MPTVLHRQVVFNRNSSRQPMQPHGLRQEAAEILFQHCPGDGLWSVADLRLGCLGAFVDVCKDTASRLEWTVWRQDAMQLGAPFIPEDLLSHVSAILLLRHPSVQQALLPHPTSTAVVASWLHGGGLLPRILCQANGRAGGAGDDECGHFTAKHLHPVQRKH